MIPLLLLIILSGCFYIYFKKVRDVLKLVEQVDKLPKKNGYPVVRNLLEFIGTPDATFRKWTSFATEYSQKGIGVMWMSYFPIVLVTEPDIIERILRNPVNNKKGLLYNIVRPWLKDGLITSEGKKWGTRRKILTPAFHFNILQKFLPIFNEESRSFTESLKKHNNCEVNVREVVSKFSLDVLCETAMGTKLSEQFEEGEKYRSAVQEFGLIAMERVNKAWQLIESVFRFSKNYWKQNAILNVLHHFTNRVIDERRKNVPDESNIHYDSISGFKRRNLAMLDLLISAHNIDDEGIREEVDTFVFAGHDTTSASITFTLMLLANNAHCQDKIYEELQTIFGEDDREATYMDIQEMKYLECCIKESLRLYPSVPKFGRMLGEDITMENGCIIPKGCTITCMIYEMHRRADLYEQPNEFIPERFSTENMRGKHPYSYLPFSAGSRNCIGQKYAMMKMKCVLAAVVRNYILEPVDRPEDIRFVMDITLRTSNPIRVKFIPRIK